MWDGIERVWNAVSLGLFDGLLGWTLRLTPDFALIVVSVATAVLMTAVRKIATDQDLLRRARADGRRLKQLIRQAKARRDRESIVRHRATQSMLAMMKLRAEARPLVLVIVPVAMLATWAVHRLAYHPPRPGEPIELVAHTPVSWEGELAHVVPETGMTAPAGWIQRISPFDASSGQARWRFEATSGDHPLTLRIHGLSPRRELRVDEGRYAVPLVDHGHGLWTEWTARPVKLFGIIPGYAPLGLPPWVVGYLIVVIPSVMLAKRAMRVW